MKQKLHKYRLPLAALGLALLCLFCLWRLHRVAGLLDSQKAAERWQGDSERSFAQISCFMPSEQLLTREQLYTFRNNMAQKLKDASFDLEKDGGLYVDAWCGYGSARVSAGRQSGEVHVIAVDGRFFDFHPLRLLSGNYLSPSDLMGDRVLLDRETAWLLFGATDLAGMSFSIGGTPFVVAGVYDHEDDVFSRRAYGEGMTIYMSYDSYAAMNTSLGIGCYEFVMAEPVKGFAYSSAQEKFPIKTAELLANTYRFETGNLLKLAKAGGVRSMRVGSAVYPYWENAARAAEDRAVVWLIAAMVTGAFPIGLLLVFLVRSFARGKRKVETELFPRARDSVQEAIRVRARRRWEKKHPGED